MNWKKYMYIYDMYMTFTTHIYDKKLIYIHIFIFKNLITFALVYGIENLGSISSSDVE